MKIKCPKCEVAYELPDNALPKEKLDGTPFKLKCFKCKTIFTIAYKPEKPEDPNNGKSGYEEFADPETHADQEHRDEQTSDEKDILVEVFNGTGDDNSSSEKLSANGMVTNTAAWNQNNTLNLSAFATQNKQSFAWFTTLMIFFGIAVTVAFFVFVSWRNDWTISFPLLGAQISNAFFGEDEPVLVTPEALASLTATLDEGYKITSRKDKRHIVVITGTVKNTDTRARRKVMLEARIVDYKGKTKRKKIAPCGWMVKDKRLKKLELGDADKIYKRNNRMFNCVIGPDGTKKFKIFFDDLPDNYNDSFSILVKPISAELKLN